MELRPEDIPSGYHDPKEPHDVPKWCHVAVWIIIILIGVAVGKIVW